MTRQSDPSDPPSLPTALVGSYTSRGGGRGAGISTWTPSAGVLDETGLVELESPSYLIEHPSEPWVFAVTEGQPSMLSSLKVSPDGGLELICSVPSGGDHACHLTLSADGQHILVAHYTSGSVTSVPLGPDGHLGPVTDLVQFHGTGPNLDRQQGPHAHQVVLDGDEVLVADLGTDCVHRLQLDRSGRFREAREPVVMPPGSGPRHLVLVQDHLIVACELSAQVWLGRRTTDGWSHLQTVPSSGLAADQTASPSAIRADGTAIFVVNRVVDTVAVFTLDPVRHELTLDRELATGGAESRDLVVTADRLWLANQNSDQVCVFDRTGGGSPEPLFRLATPSPACLVLRQSPSAIT